MYSIDEFEKMAVDDEDEVFSLIKIRQYLEMVDPEIKAMFVQAYGDDPDTVFAFDEDKRRQIETLLQLLSEMIPREQMVLALRFGFFSGKPMTLEEVAKRFGVTRERIRQIEAKALRKGGCRGLRRSKKLRDFLNN